MTENHELKQVFPFTVKICEKFQGSDLASMVLFGSETIQD